MIIPKPLSKKKQKKIQDKEDKKKDKEVRAIVFVRDGHICKRCYVSGIGGAILHPHHIVSRRFKQMRWNPDNIITLCSKCHCWQTYNPEEFLIWMFFNLPEWFHKVLLIAKENGSSAFKKFNKELDLSIKDGANKLQEE